MRLRYPILPPPTWGVYVHLPWCRVRCPYCAFNVHPARDATWSDYTDALLREWDEVRPRFEGRPSSVFFGGGTPSLTPPVELSRVLAALDPLPGAEVSIEANPEDLAAPDGEALLDAWLKLGLNRLSLGIQTFDLTLGRRLGRTRTAAAAPLALARARVFPSLSCDLIFAVPGQTEALLLADLHAALPHVDHLSLYGLTLEEGTPFGRRPELAVDDDAWADLYALATNTVEQAGLSRYEVSNFARDGHRCAHNEHYWRARPWAGLGAGAHAWWPDGTRTVNELDPAAYIALTRNAHPRIEQAVPDPAARLHDLLWSTLRHHDGAPLARIEADTGLDVVVPPDLFDSGLLYEQAGHLRLGRAGHALADGLTRRVYEATILLSSPASVTKGYQTR